MGAAGSTQMKNKTVIREKAHQLLEVIGRTNDPETVVLLDDFRTLLNDIDKAEEVAHEKAAVPMVSEWYVGYWKALDRVCSMLGCEDD